MCCGHVNLIASSNSSLYQNTIPLNQVNSGSALAELYYYRCLNPEKVKQAFSKYGPAITDNDIKGIASVHASGKDRELFNVDFLQIARDIDFSDKERDKAHCKIGFTY